MEGEGQSNSSTRDPGWKYNHVKDPKDKNRVTCNFCGKTTSGGICRAKQHLVGNSRNTKKCPKCPPEVVEELQNYMNSKKTQKAASYGRLDIDDFDDVEEFGDDEVEVIEDARVGQKRGKASCMGGANKKGSGLGKKGPMDLFLNQNIGQKESQKRQTSMVDHFDKEARDRTNQYIARFFYQAGVAFNAAKLESFKQMVEAIGRFGPNLKPPSYHELRVPLLKKELEITQNMLANHKLEWAKSGCSIMSDGWTDRNRRSIINLMVNCSLGTMFLESIDASSIEKSGHQIFELLDKFVDKVGERNVIQVVTDNGSNYKMAGRLLEAKRPQIYWTPCAAHCVDLMLEDIGKIPNVKKTIARGIFLVGYIYNHLGVLNMMKSFTNNKNLVRAGVTRFATTFLTLSSIHNQKQHLRKMFTSEQWIKSKWAKEAKGKRSQEIVIMPSFWNNVVYILKIMSPLVRVLRLVDNEKKPAMGYIYEAMDRAKETIQKAFEGNEAKYKDIFKIIDNRWECQLHRPLHAAGHYLNPEFFYSDPSIENNGELVDGLMACVAKLYPVTSEQDAIMGEVSLYKRAEGIFGNQIAIRARKTKSPAEWWSLFGASAPKLQQFAIKILSLTCSATGCERNWSVFEHIHSKKRNKLSHKKLQDLVFVKYNQALKARHDMKNIVDPISLEDIDYSNEWLVGQMGANLDASEELVHDDSDLTWGLVGRASGVGEASRVTRQGSSSRSRLIDEPLEDVEEEDEEIEDYENEHEDIMDENFVDDDMDEDDME